MYLIYKNNNASFVYILFPGKPGKKCKPILFVVYI